MKFTKKLFAVLLAALMALAVLPVAFAEDAQVAWNLAEGVLTITGNGPMPGYSVEAPEWRNYKDEITSIVIGDGVTTIGAYAFKSLDKVTTITLPASVQDIDSYAFCGCAALTGITLPAEMTAVKSGTFKDCAAITAVTIPEKVKEIQSYAFQGTGLTEIYLPESVESIAKNAFTECASLKKVTIMNTKCSIASGSFPPPTAPGSDEEPLTFYTIDKSAADNFAIANQYAYVHIPDVNKPDYGTPETIQDVLTISQDELKDTKGGSFLRRLFELLGLNKLSGDDSDKDSAGSTLTLTGPGADIGNFMMKTSFGEILMKMRKIFQNLLDKLDITMPAP